MKALLNGELHFMSKCEECAFCVIANSIEGNDTEPHIYCTRNYIVNGVPVIYDVTNGCPCKGKKSVDDAHLARKEKAFKILRGEL